MKILIIEDEYPAAERLEKLIYRLDPKIEVNGILESVESAKQWFSMGQIADLIFSDIQLSDGLSFQIFEAFPTHSPVIFTTSYDEYAIKAFKVKSIDYLLKPIKLQELAAAIKKYENFKAGFSRESYANRMELLLDSLEVSRKTYKSRFLVKNGEQLVLIHHEQIVYFYASNELTCLVTEYGKQYLIDFTLEELEAKVDPLIFFRINRQFVIRINAIEKIHTYFNGKLKVELRHETSNDVIISREKAPLFKAWMDR